MSFEVGVVGGGPWGLALARAAHRRGVSVVVLSRRRPLDLPPEVTIAQDFEAIASARLVVVAVPSSAAREVARSLGDHLDGTHLVVHGVRGLGGDHLETLTDILRDETPVRRLGALGGPVQAAELHEGRPSAMVVGSCFPEVTSAVKAAFECPTLRVYTTSDLRGLEWASALVGCLSIGVGFANGAGAGPGLVAALISRAVDEASRIAAAAGADDRTMHGLAGYGDLLASIALSDRPEVALGRALARGASLGEAIDRAKLRVEAVDLVPRVVQFAKERRVHAPAFTALAELLQGASPALVLEPLLSA